MEHSQGRGICSKGLMFAAMRAQCLWGDIQQRLPLRSGLATLLPLVAALVASLALAACTTRGGATQASLRRSQPFSQA